MVLSDKIIERATNCLYGAVIGDALGGRYEFDNHLLTSDLASLNESLLPILGGGVWGLAPGQVTDDSEMAMALATSIIRTKHIDNTTIAEYYRKWYLSDPFDIGKATKNALKHKTADEMIRSAKAYDQTLIKDFGQPNLSNGMLMRISPIAVTMAGFYNGGKISDSHFAEIIRVFVEEDTILTHASEEALCYASAYTLLLAYAIIDGNLKRGIRLVHQEYAKYQDIGDWYTIFQNGLDPKGRLAHAPTELIGDVRIAFQLAVRKGYLVSTRQMTFAEAMVSTISLKGDTDTNACIVGALCGAMCYESSASVLNEIPESWKQTVKKCKPLRYDTYTPDQLIWDLPTLAIKLLSVGLTNGS